MVDGFAKTPRYVLKDGSLPTCLSVLQTPPEVPAIVVFGFSDKPEYDLFLKNSSIALTPYPLVRGFLENQIVLDVDSLKLIVLDAVSPREMVFNAATMQSVLESSQLNSDNVAISHQLIRDESSAEYRVQILSDATRVRPVL